MSEDIERAELVAKAAISEGLGERACMTCGSDPYFAREFPRVRDKAQRLERDLRKALADLAWQRHITEMNKWERDNAKAGLQGKVVRQRQALARLYIEVQHLRAELRRAGKCDTTTSSGNSEQADQSPSSPAETP